MVIILGSHNANSVIYSGLSIWIRRNDSEGMKVSCSEAGMHRGLPSPVIILQPCSHSVAEKTFCSFDLFSIRPEGRDVRGEGERRGRDVVVTQSVICWTLQSHVKFFMILSHCLN